jgi:hypothetical protein
LVISSRSRTAPSVIVPTHPRARQAFENTSPHRLPSSQWQKSGFAVDNW